jgi:phosphoglycolate phosphatase
VIDHVIFDLDGTLVDSNMICVEILNDMLRDRGSVQQVHPEHAKLHMSVGGTHMVATLLGVDCGDPEQEIVEFRRRYADRATPQNSLFDGVREGLSRLHAQGFRLAICSNKPQSLCDKVLAELAIAPLFAVVVGGGAGLRPKPAPDLMEATIAKLGVAKQQCLFVGDSELDYEQARICGLRFAFVTYGYCRHDWDRAGVEAFDRFADIIDMITRSRPSATGEGVEADQNHGRWAGVNSGH